MVKINKKNDSDKIFYSVSYVLFAFFVVYSLYYKPLSFFDVLTCFALFWVVYYLFKRYGFSKIAFVGLTTSIGLHLFGAFGFYSHFLFGPIGYDKLVHVFSSFAGAYAFLTSDIEKDLFLRYLIAIFLVLGVGALVEINEFVGSTYFGIDKGGIFAQGDGLPFVKSDLQVHDTYFDMIANLVGSLIAVFFGVINNFLTNKKNFRNYKT